MLSPQKQRAKAVRSSYARSPLVVKQRLCCKSFAVMNLGSSLALNSVVVAEKDKVADRFFEELGFAPESVSDDGLVIPGPTQQVVRAPR